MYHFFKYAYEGYRPVRYVVNPVRCVEAILCLTCLALALFMVSTLTYIPVVFMILITLTAAAFSTITIIDLISNSYMNPIYWNTWTLFAITGALLFFACAGALLATFTGVTMMLILGEAFNAVTAIIFLLDALLILNALRKRQSEVWPEEEAKREHKQLPDDKSEMGEQPTQETTTIERVFESTISVDDDKTTIQNKEEERITEHISELSIPGTPKQKGQESAVECLCGEPSPKRRSSISYGGTFPVGKDEAPLPSPEPVYSQSRIPTRRRSSSIRPSGSQTITTVPYGRVRKGVDGEMYLADGTPLTEVRLDNGDTGYRNPCGVLYTKEGTPIATDNSRGMLYTKEGTPIATDNSYTKEGTPIATNGPARVETIKETYRQQFKTSSLSYRNGEWYTPDGRKVPSVNKNDDQKLMTKDGMPLYEIATGAGKVVYEDNEGFVYSSDGIPIGYDADLQKNIYRRHHTQDRGITGITEVRLHEEGHQKPTDIADSRAEVGKTRSQPGRARRDEGIPYDLLPKGDSKQDREIIRVRQETITIQAKQPAKTVSGASFLSEEGKRGSCRVYLSDGTPVNEVTTDSGTQLYEGPDGELFASDGTPLTSRLQIAGPCLPCRRDQDPPRHLVCKSTSPTEARERRSLVDQRTVSVSTRMIPKSAPRSQKSFTGDIKDSVPRVKSAEVPQSPALAFYQQEQPTAIYQQCFPKQCQCGQMHYQTVSQVQGLIYSAPYQSQQALPPPQVSEGQPSENPSSPQNVSEKSHLQTISEGEYEAENAAPSAWKEHRSDRTSDSAEPTSSETTSENIASASCDKCYVCEDKSCTIHQVREVISGDAQTSETRMIKASDLQRMNLNLPGSADTYRK